MSSTSPAPARAIPARARAARVRRVSHRRHRVAARALDDPAPVEAWQLWFGFVSGLSPFVIAAWEFGKRVAIQRACAVCGGSGLVTTTRGTTARKVKCRACGGFLPWESWERFLTSEVGNGGVVRAPMGQKSALYDVAAATRASREVAAREGARADVDADAARERESEDGVNQ